MSFTSAAARGVSVRISKSLLNNNYNRSIFGGTIFAATDPFYPILFHQLFSHKGYKVICWSKSSQILYLKPALTNLQFSIRLTEDEMNEAGGSLNITGKYIKTHLIDVYDAHGDVCASVQSEVYMRDLEFAEDAGNNE